MMDKLQRELPLKKLSAMRCMIPQPRFPAKKQFLYIEYLKFHSIALKLFQ